MSKAKFLNIIQLLCLPLKNNGTVSRSLCLVVQKYMYKCLYKYDMNDFVVKVKPGPHQELEFLNPRATIKRRAAGQEKIDR